MRIVLTMAMIVGSSTLLHAGAMRHHAYVPRHAESFMGLAVTPRPAIPLYPDLGMCNGGPCTLSGGPSGGPNQS